MALQHFDNKSYQPPLQTNNVGRQSSIPRQEEKKSNDNNDDEFEMDSLPLIIFGMNGAKFICEKCDRVPIKVASCNSAHIFCRKCLEDLCNKKELCPVDKAQITQPTLQNPILDKMVSQEKVCCLYSSKVASAASKSASELSEGGGVVTDKGDGCRWEGTVAELFSHLPQCKYKPFKCPFSHIGCKPETDEKKNNDKIQQHYNESNVIHQNLILNEIRNIKDTISS
eukprot:398998_1